MKKRNNHGLHTFVYLFCTVCLMWINSVLLYAIYNQVEFHIDHELPILLKLFLLFFFTMLLMILEMPIISLFRPNWQDPFTYFLDTFKKVGEGEFEIPKIKHSYRGRFDRLAEGMNEMVDSLKAVEAMRQEFISTVSHEIQSPLTSIKGFASILKEESLPLAKQKHYLSIIEDECRRLSSISDNLLQLTRLERLDNTVDKHNFYLDQQIRSCVLNCESQWTAKNIDIVLDLEPVEFLGAEELLFHVWSNIIHNGIKFSPTDSTIQITMSISDTFVIVVFLDEGIGIEGDNIPLLFDRFFKADKSRNRNDINNGSGLGLSIVKKIVELHEGQITAASQGLGKGTSFTITLPIQD
ncbi:sensor histidine kinase [Spirochaeta cellobiosiphila]|uniref:sensor histidine kinase n=1 Tax=Spirochaeta cellobiosiphila TaxID=504483 RepID=UPI0003FC873A|nr:HAMP domain-containing sensor histidine kinase [Spirochaeta cellobiosiphila]